MPTMLTIFNSINSMKRWARQVMNVYTCEVCHYRMQTTIVQSYKCPACQGEMRFDTTTNV